MGTGIRIVVVAQRFPRPAVGNRITGSLWPPQLLPRGVPVSMFKTDRPDASWRGRAQCRSGQKNRARREAKPGLRLLIWGPHRRGAGHCVWRGQLGGGQSSGPGST